ncbi:hypothetical protein DFH08DRAFT_739693 [Mycena albidolilacea]|uniref:Enoyl reductase (ER) domain-containing protein n=1 Tax=Mycena albidolilacea TaxID=1033008 RepID=A0AAD7A8B5_9AGAR|nr:hypothetical protein DFH08DRAFT_739693 [Mycena albidolilacea]
MAPKTNGRVLFNSFPADYPVPGETVVHDTSQTIDIETHPLNGGLLVKTLVLSIDPYMRGRMSKPDKSYAARAPFAIGEPIVGFGIGVVVRSENSEVPAGKYIYGIAVPHQEYFVLADITGFIFLEKNPGLSWSVYLGAAGMPGKTAFAGWKEYSHAKKGEVAFVTTGAGMSHTCSVESLLNQSSHRTCRGVRAFPLLQIKYGLLTSSCRMVIQLAKQDGLKVIASAGSDEKVKFMREIGADVAFNYKSTDTREVLEREGPIDVYWDNVGGDVLDAALEHAAIHARFLVCGMISGYNIGYQGIRNLNLTYMKSLAIYGIAILRLGQYDEEFYTTIPRALAAGELKYSEDVKYGLDTVGEVLLAVQTGANTGKAVVVVAEE